MPDKSRAWSGSKLFDTLMVSPKDFVSEKVDFEKREKEWKNIPQQVKG